VRDDRRLDDCDSSCCEWVHGVMMTVTVGAGDGYMAS
jgi:hypothetical protein